MVLRCAQGCEAARREKGDRMFAAFTTGDWMSVESTLNLSFHSGLEGKTLKEFENSVRYSSKKGVKNPFNGLGGSKLAYLLGAKSSI